MLWKGLLVVILSSTLSAAYPTSDLKDADGSIHASNHSDNSSVNYDQDTDGEQYGNYCDQWLQTDILQTIFRYLNLKDLRTAAQYVSFYIYPNGTQ